MKKIFHKLIVAALLLSIALALMGTPMMATEAYAANGTPAAAEEVNEAAPLAERLGRETLKVEAEAKETVDTKKLVEQTAKIAQYVNNIFNPLIHFFTFKIGALLNNDYIYAGGMGGMLQNIWRVSRNMVNIAFVLILLFLALKQIIGGDENTDLKKILPRFALMLIAVNFSWLASKVILDASNVVTNITFSIPSAVKGVTGDKLNDLITSDCRIEDTDSGTGKPSEGCQPTKIYMPPSAQRIIHAKAEECTDDIDKKYQEVYPQTGEGVGPDHESYKAVFGKTIYCWKTMDVGDYSQNTASYFLSFSMAKVQNLVQASSSDIGKLAIGSIMAFLIQIVYLVAFACLFIALILRIAALWLFVAFSPIIVLLLFMKTSNLGLGTGGELANKISVGAFAHWAFAPAMVGAVWAVGFLMVSAGQSMSADFFEKLNELGEPGRIIDVQTLFVGMENIQQFIWLLMSVGIVWVGTFAVLTKLSFGKAIFDYVNTAGTKFASYVAKSPTWAPIIPLYDAKTGKFEGRISLEKLAEKISPNKMIEAYRHGITAEAATEFSKAANKLTEALKKDAEKQKIEKYVAENNAPEAIKFLVAHGGISAEKLKDTANRSALQTMLTTSFGKDQGEKLYALITKHFEAAGTAEPPATEAQRPAGVAAPVAGEKAGPQAAPAPAPRGAGADQSGG